VGIEIGYKGCRKTRESSGLITCYYSYIVPQFPLIVGI
jgi:hypothetical protein